MTDVVVSDIKGSIDNGVTPELDRMAEAMERSGIHPNISARGTMFWAITRLRKAGLTEELILNMVREDLSAWSKHARKAHN